MKVSSVARRLVGGAIAVLLVGCGWQSSVAYQPPECQGAAPLH
jgi:hypothetical protein